MKHIIFILLTSSLLLITSCGGKGKTSSSFSLTLGAVTGAATQNGGVIITGHKLDDSAHIQLGFMPGEELSVELENGVWEFAAVSWAGVNNETFTGDHYCGYVPPIDLQGGEENISFNLSASNCDDVIDSGDRFSDPGHFNSAVSDQFRVLRVRSCLSNPASISSSSCTLAGDKGLTKSYKLIFGDSDGIVKSLSSSCYNIEDQDEVGESHNVKIPIGDSNGNIFSFKIRAFTGLECSGEIVAYPFYDGIFSGLAEENKQSIVDNSLDGDNTYLFLEHNPLTQTIDINPLFGFGNLGEVTLTADFDVPVASYSRIKGINSTDTRLITVDDSSLFLPHEELMWLSNEEGTMGNACSGFTPGIYGHSRIKSIPDSVTIELYEPIDIYNLDSGTTETLALPTGTSLSDATNTSMFCSMQLIKFANYENLTVNGGGGTVFVKPMAYDKANGIGGVLALKVQDTLKTEGSNVTISANEKGRASGDIFNYDACPTDKKCAYLGDNSGGGIIFINAANLEVDGTNTHITSIGANNAGGPGGDGGSILFNGNSVDINATRTLQFFGHGGTGTTLGGNGGSVSYNYCSSVSTNNGVFSTTDISAGTGSPDGSIGIEDNDTSFCPL
jgi:hypothetical protein